MSMISCAVQECEHQDIRKTGEMLLRVTPKSTPFVGMCKKHYVEYLESTEYALMKEATDPS